MATNTPGANGILDNVVLGTVHMHVKRGVSPDIIDLVVTSFPEKDIVEARNELTDCLGMVEMGGHRDTPERSAASLYAKELVALVHELDRDKRLPKVVVSSDQLARIPIGKVGLTPVEAVPISARMNNLEDTVKKLCESFEKFKNDNQNKTVEKTFASVLSGGIETL